MIKTALAFDDTTEDLAYPLQIIRGDSALVQRIKSVLRTFKGEWFLDKTIGLPWISDVFQGTQSKREVIDSILRKAILAISGVVSIKSINTTFDNTNRIAKISIEIITETGTEILEEISL